MAGSHQQEGKDGLWYRRQVTVQKRKSSLEKGWHRYYWNDGALDMPLHYRWLQVIGPIPVPPTPQREPLFRSYHSTNSPFNCPGSASKDSIKSPTPIRQH